jgi:acyl dehydratase
MADLASLPGTITHGMWSSASAARVVRDAVGGPLLSFKAAFKGMVLPGSVLHTQVRFKE